MEGKKILILTMSCNQPYYQALLSCVRDTWAKPLIKNEYENITWFAYTSCDEKHPEPGIYWDDHMIYVDCPDDLTHSYLKTQMAYNFVKLAGVEFDYVVRTNTSVFINIKNLIERVNEVTGYEILARSMYMRDLGYFCFIGFFLGCNRDIFDVGMSANNEYIRDEFGNVIPSNDDTIFSVRIFNVLKEHTMNGPINKQGDILPAYKVYDKDDVPDNLFQLPQKDYMFDPEIVNDYVCIRYRSMYDKGDDRKKKGREMEHCYELYNALK